jgi:predicted metal-dependent phosphoesterase TrpH
VIDLHLHTTASDGRSTPEALMAEVSAAGCHTVAVTDHDTVAGVLPAREAALRAGLSFITGIEMTAVVDGTDVHILGYFLDVTDAALDEFLRLQRERRRERVAAMADRLRQIGAPVDVAAILAVPADSGRAVGRPAVAQALVAAGHAADIADAFNRFLAEGRPGHLPRVGPGPAEVIARLRAAGGIASLAHPGKLRRDELIQPMIADGLDALEVYHSDHSVGDVVRYQGLADRHGVMVTGGSDYHGPGSGRTTGLGEVGLPPAAFDRLVALAGRPR